MEKKGWMSMSKSLLLLSLCIVLLSPTLPVLADERGDCIDGCKQALAPCVEQARLTAGNIQEEQDLIAACKTKKVDCIDACKVAADAPDTPGSPPPPQE